MLSSKAITLLIAAAASWGVSAGPCIVSSASTSASSLETPTTTQDASSSITPTTTPESSSLETPATTPAASSLETPATTPDASSPETPTTTPLETPTATPDTSSLETPTPTSDTSSLEPIATSDTSSLPPITTSDTSILTTALPTTTTTSTTTTTEEEPRTSTFYEMFRRRDDGEPSDEPVMSAGKGVSLEDDAEHANNGDHYVLVKVTREDEETPSMEETISHEIENSGPGVFSYSWALAEHQDFGSEGSCSIISKLDGVVVDTLQFHSAPAYVYHSHEVEVPFVSPNPAISMDFVCSGVGFDYADVLIDDVNLAVELLGDELRR